MYIQDKSPDQASSESAPTAEAHTLVSVAVSGAAPATDAVSATNIEVADTAISAVVAISSPAVVTNSVAVVEIKSKQVQTEADEVPFIEKLRTELNLCISQHGKAYAVLHGKRKNPLAIQLGSRALDNIIRRMADDDGYTLRKAELRELNDSLLSHAESSGKIVSVFLRVAAVDDGVEIDLGDPSHHRVRITAGKVELIAIGSKALFWRSTTLLPMAPLVDSGDLHLLKQYLNLDDMSFMLLRAWLSYTLAHPKVASSMYLILLLLGGQGSGKSYASKLIRRLLDPSPIGVQTLPNNSKDLAISTQNAHVSCYDNARYISPAMSDYYCTAATGGTLSTRQLYTDADQQVILLHGALIINGIHAFINQPDFAQRCLPIQLPTLPEGKRRSESELEAALARDLPAIQRGLFDLIAAVFTHRPTVKASSPQRMIDFVLWLAAMEMVDGVPEGIYQDAYSSALNDGQRECLMDNALASAILSWAQSMSDDAWTGAPARFLEKLNNDAEPSLQNASDWPNNPIALSKRIIPLQAALLSQGIELTLLRGKTRKISIKWLDGMRPDKSIDPDDDAEMY